MPARLARTPADEQIKEVTGSGPFKFVQEEWQPGHRVVYVRNPDYVPRAEPPSFGAGGKQVYVDRIEWLNIPDPATASAALAAGEVDYWEYPLVDFISQLEKNPNITVSVVDAMGTQGWLRPIICILLLATSERAKPCSISSIRRRTCGPPLGIRSSGASVRRTSSVVVPGKARQEQSHSRNQGKRT